MKKWILIMLALLSLLVVSVNNTRHALIGSWVLPREGIRQALYSVCTEPDLAMTTSDGTVLRAETAFAGSLTR